jgi:hypothetical protein
MASRPNIARLDAAVQPAEAHIVVSHQRDLAARRVLSADPAVQRVAQPMLIADAHGMVASARAIGNSRA